MTLATRLTDHDQQYFPHMTDTVGANDVARLANLSFVSEISVCCTRIFVGCSVPAEGESPGFGVNR